MNRSNDLLSQETHFEFGKNWASYAKLIGKEQIDIAVSELRRLFDGPLDGKRILDIGCGSGLHSLAALRLGAAEVVAIDIDADSVTTTRTILEGHGENRSWQVHKMSVFDVDPRQFEAFDVVYSWGVLHHTGDMVQALRRAAMMVRPGGQFAFALYRKTPFCWFWRIEKRWYAHAKPKAQAIARMSYVALFRLRCLLTLRSYKRHVAEYRSDRGMDFFHDVHDWMGGWPYESISPRQVDLLMRSLGFEARRSFLPPRFVVGLFGSGCDEYVYARPSVPGVPQG